MGEGFNDSNTTHQIFSSRVKIPATEYIGDQGRIFFREDTGELRISDGVTPFGKPIYFSGGGSGGVTLRLYAENGSPAVPPIASAYDAIALGDGALAYSQGSIVQSAGTFSNSGDAQIGSYVARNITVNGVVTELFLNGAATRFVLQPNSTVAFTITITARRTDSGMEGAVYELRGGIDRGVLPSTTSLIGHLNKTVVTEDNPVWDAFADADIATGALRIWVKGENSKTVRWVAHIQTVEVKN